MAPCQQLRSWAGVGMGQAGARATARCAAAVDGKGAGGTDPHHAGSGLRAGGCRGLWGGSRTDCHQVGERHIGAGAVGLGLPAQQALPGPGRVQAEPGAAGTRAAQQTQQCRSPARGRTGAAAEQGALPTLRAQPWAQGKAFHAHTLHHWAPIRAAGGCGGTGSSGQGGRGLRPGHYCC